jgi:hypothetical protein
VFNSHLAAVLDGNGSISPSGAAAPKTGDLPIMLPSFPVSLDRHAFAHGRAYLCLSQEPTCC